MLGPRSLNSCAIRQRSFFKEMEVKKKKKSNNNNKQDGKPFKDVPSFKSPIKTSDNVKLMAKKVFYFFLQPSDLTDRWTIT